MASRVCSISGARAPRAARMAQARNVGCSALTQQRTELKSEVIDLAAKLDRGLNATKTQQSDMEALVQKLEKANPNPKSLEAAEINGKWKLIYTTSESILGTKRPPPLRPSDVDKLRAQNNEGFPFFNAVTADLTPVSKSKVNVQFDTFKIGNFLPVKAPPSAKGSLDTTYVDEEMRISRGDKGNLFVLLMADPNFRL